MKRELGVVLQREVIRQSRRWQTYGLRFAFSALVLFGFLVVTLASNSGPADQLARLGRTAFSAYLMAQLMMVCFSAPILVANGVLEERDAKTLDLLAISGLRPRQILYGQVGARLLVLLTIVAAGAPVLSLVLTFGGIGVWQVLNATVNTAAIAVVLGAVGGFCAIFARSGPIVPLVGAFLFILPAFWFLPENYAELGGPLAVPTHLSPLHAIWSETPFAAGVGLVYLPVLLQLAALALPVFRIATTDEDTEEFGALSPDIWTVERFRKRTGKLWVLLVIGWMAWGIAFSGTPYVLLSGSLQVPDLVHGIRALTCWLLCWAVLVLGTRSFLLSWMNGASHARLFLSRERRGTRRPAEVWGNPVWWRETSARSGCANRVLVGGSTAIWALVALLWLTLGDGWGDEDSHLFLAGAALLIAFTAAMLSVTETLIEERRARTLPLLLITTSSRERILFGKLLAAWWRAAPLLAMALVLVGRLFLTMEQPTSSETAVSGPNLLPHLAILKPLALGGWALAVLSTCTLSCILIAAWASPPRVAWPAVPVVAAAWWIVPALTLALTSWIADLFDQEDGFTPVITQLYALWWPLEDFEYLFHAGIPQSLLLSTLTQVFLCLALAFAIRIRLQMLMRLDA